MSDTPSSTGTKGRKKIPADVWAKMTRSEKKQFFREEEVKYRARKTKASAPEGAEVTLDSGMTVEHEAPGRGLEEHKEEEPIVETDDVEVPAPQP